MAIERQRTERAAWEAPSTVPRVLVVQRDAAYAAVLTRRFQAAGFQVVGCAGPHPPDYHCYVLTGTSPGGEPAPPGAEGRCPIVEIVDVLVYDPWLYATKGSSDASALIRALRRRYPSQPIVLAWPEQGLPRLGDHLMLDPAVHVGPSDPDALVEFVRGVCADGLQAKRR